MIQAVIHELGDSVLVLNAGESPKDVAERLETITPTVFKWRNQLH